MATGQSNVNCTSRRQAIRTLTASFCMLAVTAASLISALPSHAESLNNDHLDPTLHTVSTSVHDASEHWDEEQWNTDRAVSVSGVLRRTVVDSFSGPHSESDGHSESLTYLEVETGEHIQLIQTAEVSSIAPATAVDVELAVPAALSQPTGPDQEFSPDEAVAALEPTSAPVPVLSIEEVSTTPTNSSGLSDPLGVGTHRLTAAGSASVVTPHRVFVVLPIPLDYTGPGYTCADVTLCEPTNWKNTNGPISADLARQLITNASSYWTEQTNGHFPGLDLIEVKRVRVPFTSDQLCSGTSSGINSLYQHWLSLDNARGFNNIRQSDHLIALSGSCGAGVDGFASLGTGLDDGGVMQIRNGSLFTLIHELGHNFSLGHSNVEVVDGKYAGTSVEYFGLHSPMGLRVIGFDAVPALDTGFKDFLGVLGPSEMVTASTPGTFTLSSVSGTSGTRGLKVLDPNAARSYYVEYRDRTGQDVGAAYGSNALISRNGITLELNSGVRVYSLFRDSSGNASTTFAWPSATATSRHVFALSSGQSLTAFSQFTPNAFIAVNSLQGKTAVVQYGLNETQGAIPFDGNAPSDDGTPSSKPSTGSTPQPAQPPTSSMSAPKVSLSVASGKYGKSRKATIKVSNPVPTGATLTVYVDGKKVVSSAVRSSTTTYPLPKTLPAGKHTLTVSVQATKTTRAVSASRSFTVPKLASAIKGFPQGTKKVKVGKTFKATITTNAPGTLQRKSGKKWVAVKSLKSGKNTWKLRVTKSTKKTSYRVVIKKSSQRTAATSKTVTIKPVRK